MGEPTEWVTIFSGSAEEVLGLHIELLAFGIESREVPATAARDAVQLQVETHVEERVGALLEQLTTALQEHRAVESVPPDPEVARAAELGQTVCKLVTTVLGIPAAAVAGVIYLRRVRSLPAEPEGHRIAVVSSWLSVGCTLALVVAVIAWAIRS